MKPALHHQRSQQLHRGFASKRPLPTARPEDGPKTANRVRHAGRQTGARPAAQKDSLTMPPQRRPSSPGCAASAGALVLAITSRGVIPCDSRPRSRRGRHALAPTAPHALNAIPQPAARARRYAPRPRSSSSSTATPTPTGRRAAPLVSIAAGRSWLVRPGPYLVAGAAHHRHRRQQTHPLPLGLERGRDHQQTPPLERGAPYRDASKFSLRQRRTSLWCSRWSLRFPLSRNHPAA